MFQTTIINSTESTEETSNEVKLQTMQLHINNSKRFIDEDQLQNETSVTKKPKSGLFEGFNEPNFFNVAVAVASPPIESFPHVPILEMGAEAQCDDETLQESDQKYPTNDVLTTMAENPEEPSDVISDSIRVLLDDNTDVRKYIEDLETEQKKLRDKTRSLEKSLAQVIAINETYQKTIKDLQEKYADLSENMRQCASGLCADGSFIWKIKGINQKISEAINEQQISFYSSPFYLSTYGYKVRLRLFLNGDGQARNTHVSIFFVLMRGDYDSLLPWPFKRKVIFCLHDQTGNGRHVIQSFTPDPKSKSFHRPISDMNFSSGIPQFCSVALIRQDNNPYVRDDTMYIRCLVDFEDSSKLSVTERCNVDLSKPVILSNLDRQVSTENSTEKSEPST